MVVVLSWNSLGWCTQGLSWCSMVSRFSPLPPTCPVWDSECCSDLETSVCVCFHKTATFDGISHVLTALGKNRLHGWACPQIGILQGGSSGSLIQSLSEMHRPWQILFETQSQDPWGPRETEVQTWDSRDQQTWRYEQEIKMCLSPERQQKFTFSLSVCPI